MASEREDQAVGHGEFRGLQENGEWRSTCLCNASWTHPKSRTHEEMSSIFESHIKYFKNKTVIL